MTNLFNMTENTDAINRDKTIIRTSIIGIIANAFLAGFKAAVGILSNSIAITLDAVNNLSDAGSSLVTIIGTKLAGKQPDKKHPWGYGRIEYLSAMIIGIIVMYAGITSLRESVDKIIHPEVPSYSTVSLIIVGAAVLVKIMLGLFVQSTGKKVNSASLVNSGKDALMDSIISAATLVSAFIFILTGFSPEAWLGAVISLMIIKAGIEMLAETISAILGQRVEAETVKTVRQSIMSFPEVRGVYDIIFHDYGPDRLNCSAQIEIDDTMTADKIDKLQRDITAKVFLEQNIIITALSVYSINTQNEHAVKVRSEIYKSVMDIPHVIQVHGFYLDEAAKRIQFDVIVDFDAKDRCAIYEQVMKNVKSLYPDYDILCVPDTDFSVSE